MFSLTDIAEEIGSYGRVYSSFEEQCISYAEGVAWKRAKRRASEDRRAEWQKTYLAIRKDPQRLARRREQTKQAVLRFMAKNPEYKLKQDRNYRARKKAQGYIRKGNTWILDESRTA